ncbi:carbon-nitrogen family hydrolase [Actinomadura sp. KC06]|nr:nitrilase-related carbon-nitrogen hydrolase [Actinomadura sp. KC06]TDD34972.1 carbon-nitrogen family hydrolase [Actinomadura sp. KC06]
MVSVPRGRAFVVLPERWPTGYLAIDDYARTAEDLDGPTVRALGAAARTTGVHLHAESMVERDPDGRLYNTSLLFAPDDRLVHTHRKLHLCGSGAKEADLLEPGNSVRVQETEIGRIGIVTCYDLSFPEILRMLAEDGAELVLVTATWRADRIAHWRLLVPARALENQVHLLACNAIGYQRQVEVGGESMAVDPWGRVTAASWRWPRALTGALDPGAVSRARADPGVLRSPSHRRPGGRRPPGRRPDGREPVRRNHQRRRS